MFEAFMVRALLAGIGVALVAGVLGCFVVWRRMAYFGDSLAHSALLGVSLGMVLGVNMHVGIIGVCVVFSVLLLWLRERQYLATDTLLGLFAHAGLSIGMVVISFVESAAINLHSFLFGDILTVQQDDVLWIYAIGVLILVLLWRNWSKLVLSTLHEDMARAEGVNTFRQNMLLLGALALLVAIAMQVVGVLLITSLLIIPAAAGRCFARSPEGMALWSVLVAVLSVVGGMYSSYEYDTPAGPSIVVVATCLFGIIQGLGVFFKK